MKGNVRIRFHFCKFTAWAGLGFGARAVRAEKGKVEAISCTTYYFRHVNARVGDGPMSSVDKDIADINVETSMIPHITHSFILFILMHYYAGVRPKHTVCGQWIKILQIPRYSPCYTYFIFMAYRILPSESDKLWLIICLMGIIVQLIRYHYLVGQASGLRIIVSILRLQ